MEPGLELEARVLLSTRAAAMTNARHARATVPRETPYKEINDQYNMFENAFKDFANLYVTSIDFRSYIINSTNQLAIVLVQYFNGLPLKLPYFNTPPHTPNNRGAIQSYIYNSVAGSGPTSLQQSLLNIPPPTTTGSSDLTSYWTTAQLAIAQSKAQTLNGVSEIYAGQLRVAGPIPNNRYGADESGTVPAYILAPS